MLKFELQLFTLLPLLLAAFILFTNFSKLRSEFKMFAVLIAVNFIYCAAGPYLKNSAARLALTNIYLLLNAILMLWLLWEWELGERARKLIIVTACLLTGLWFMEVLRLSSIRGSLPFFRIASSFIIALLSVGVLMEMLLYKRERIKESPICIACLAFAFFSLCDFGIGVFAVMIQKPGEVLLSYSYYVDMVIQIIINFLYLATAKLCTQKTSTFYYR